MAAPPTELAYARILPFAERPPLNNARTAQPYLHNFWAATVERHRHTWYGTRKNVTPHSDFNTSLTIFKAA